MIVAYIGLGSNLDNPVEQLTTAFDEISVLPQTHRLAVSSLYSNPPMGPQEQPDYVNAVMGVETRLSPHHLLEKLQAIENQHYRVRNGERWSARTLDLDVLLYGQQCIQTEDLIVPHVGLYERPFVLYPLHEIAPLLEIPGKGSLRQLLDACSDAGLQKLTPK